MTINILFTKDSQFKFDDQITPYQYAKVHYESIVDWEHVVDHLHVNPKFHGRDCHDYVLIQTHADGFCFAQLIYMFEITHAKQMHALALILPMDEPVPTANWLCNKDL